MQPQSQFLVFSFYSLDMKWLFSFHGLVVVSLLLFLQKELAPGRFYVENEMLLHIRMVDAASARACYL